MKRVVLLLAIIFEEARAISGDTQGIGRMPKAEGCATLEREKHLQDEEAARLISELKQAMTAAERFKKTERAYNEAVARHKQTQQKLQQDIDQAKTRAAQLKSATSNAQSDRSRGDVHSRKQLNDDIARLTQDLSARKTQRRGLVYEKNALAVLLNDTLTDLADVGIRSIAAQNDIDQYTEYAKDQLSKKNLALREACADSTDTPTMEPIETPMTPCREKKKLERDFDNLKERLQARPLCEE